MSNSAAFDKCMSSIKLMELACARTGVRTAEYDSRRANSMPTTAVESR